MATRINWSNHPENKITTSRWILSFLSLKVREDQFRIFWRNLKPRKNSKVLDVGVTPNQDLIDSNFFEKRYPYSTNLTAVSVEDCGILKEFYPHVTFKKIEPFKKLPFPDHSFDIGVSWATIEHVGDRFQQAFFVSELCRVARQVFITTPNKYFFYEPHSGLIFVHWLPNKYFGAICRVLGKRFWGDIRNLNPLGKNDFLKMLPEGVVGKVVYHKMFDLFNSHMMLFIKNKK